MLIVQSDKHCFDVGSGHVLLSYYKVTDGEMKMKNYANKAGTVLALARIMPT
jgi:hypothetical protein